MSAWPNRAGDPRLPEGGESAARARRNCALALAAWRSWPRKIPRMAAPALQNLKAALLMENDDVFTWYETAQAYSMLKNEPMANLSTAEALVQCRRRCARRWHVRHSRARQGLAQGTPDWQRANDIIGVAADAAAQAQQRCGIGQVLAAGALAGAIGGALVDRVCRRCTWAGFPARADQRPADRRPIFWRHPELLAEMMRPGCRPSRTSARSRRHRPRRDAEDRP